MVLIAIYMYQYQFTMSVYSFQHICHTLTSSPSGVVVIVVELGKKEVTKSILLSVGA